MPTPDLSPKRAQVACNNFTRRFKLPVPAIAQDGKLGDKTKARIRYVKYWLGWIELESGGFSDKITEKFIYQAFNPYKVPQKQRARGAYRRNLTKARVRKARARSASGNYYGYRQGPPAWSSSRATAEVAVPVAERFGAPVTSRKRIIALNGNWSSDHNTWNLKAYAIDLGTFHGAPLAHAIAKALGITNYSTGNYQIYRVVRGSRVYHVQILWAVSGHWNHVHCGVKRVG